MPQFLTQPSLAGNISTRYHDEPLATTAAAYEATTVAGNVIVNTTQSSRVYHNGKEAGFVKNSKKYPKNTGIYKNSTRMISEIRLHLQVISVLFPSVKNNLLNNRIIDINLYPFYSNKQK